ncbi:MAG: ImmA/IrrE family metallo-endopeptidase [Proteobacteria bacterium]|nr:MAG: ImmA/IrrE family metallo-endopeptidase [Pseudomonadota bacterium]
MSTSAIGYRIRERRRELGVTQAAMARRLGISASYLNLIEANKRALGGELLGRLAELLDLEIDVLTGAVERRLSDDLRELPTDPLLQHISLEPEQADELVARHPDWVRAILTLYRAYLDNNETVAMLSNRLARDPPLQESVHRMRTHITSIRSSAEILNDVDDLEPGQRRRFQATIHDQSAELSETAHHLVSYFEQGEMGNRSMAAAEEVDDFIISHRNYFPDLEEAAVDFRRSLRARGGRSIDNAVGDFLLEHHDIGVETAAIEETGRHEFRNQCHFDTDTNRLFFLANAPATTRRFQMLRVAAELRYASLLDQCCEDARLSSAESKTRGRRALASYVAGAVLLPYDEFLDDAERSRYDIEILRQRYEAGYEQICHRLVSLREPKSEGIPFAFLRADPSGHISKRFPLFGFPLPRYGHACPLWNVFTAFQTPFRVVRQLSEFPSGRRFLMISRTVTKRAAAFHEQPVMFAVMLACDTLHADRTIYAEGLDFEAYDTAVRVGSTCRLCSRESCQQRQERAISVMST